MIWWCTKNLSLKDYYDVDNWLESGYGYDTNHDINGMTLTVLILIILVVEFDSDDMGT